MSRVAKNPIQVPAGVEVTLSGQSVKVKSAKGELSFDAHDSVEILQQDSVLTFAARDDATSSNALAGTTRAVVNNMVTGVSKGFEKPMQIFGTGYNLKEQGGKLVLNVGYCHPVELKVPLRALRFRAFTRSQ